MASSDGLILDEITKILLKTYMNSITTTHSKKFYNENQFANNSNIFSSGLLIDLPPIYNTTPNLINVNNDVSLSEYLSYSAIPVISINSDWFDEKIKSNDRKKTVGSFSVDSDDNNIRTILRLENIKLDYLGNGSSAFSCIDKNGVNILQNLIPSNYSTSGYGIALQYDEYGDGNLKPIAWLTSSSILSEEFGAALYDAKNGIVTFYDMTATNDSQREELFSDKYFYLTATKYIGINNINILRSLEIIGDVSMQSNLDVSNTLFVHNNLFVDSDVSLGSHLQVVGDVSMETNLDISSNLP